jgi:hypothetical protein
VSDDRAIEVLAQAYSRRRQERLNAEGLWEGRPEPPDPDSTWPESAEEWREEVRHEMRWYVEALASAGLQITDAQAWRTVWMESVPKKRSLEHASKSLDRIHGIARAHLPGAGGSGA